MADLEPLVKIEAFIRKFIQPIEEEWEAFANILQFRSLLKKEFLLQAGQVCNFTLFVNSGVLRESSYLNEKEITVDFVGEDQFTSDYQSFILMTPSEQYLEVVTDNELIIFKKDSINLIYDKYKIWERFGRG